MCGYLVGQNISSFGIQTLATTNAESASWSTGAGGTQETDSIGLNNCPESKESSLMSYILKTAWEWEHLPNCLCQWISTSYQNFGGLGGYYSIKWIEQWSDFSFKWSFVEYDLYQWNKWGSYNYLKSR